MGYFRRPGTMVGKCSVAELEIWARECSNSPGLKNVPLAWDHPEFVSARHLLDLMKAGPCPTKKSLSSVDEQATNNQPTKKAGKVKDAQKEQLKSDDDGTIDEPTFPKFMDLPLEIRDQIYSLAIEIPKPSPGVMISFKEGQRAPIRMTETHFAHGTSCRETCQ